MVGRWGRTALEQAGVSASICGREFQARKHGDMPRRQSKPDVGMEGLPWVEVPSSVGAGLRVREQMLELIP